MKLAGLYKCFFEYSNEKGVSYSKFPLDTEVDEFGAPYIEISDNEKIAVVARDHGQECMRKETSSVEEMARWVFELFNKPAK